MEFVASLIRKQYTIDGQQYRSTKNKIGEGAFAVVNHVQHVKSKAEYAVKRIVCSSMEQIAEANRELQVLERLQKHVNILPFLGKGLRKNKRGQDEILLLMPFYRLGTVGSIVDRGGGYPSCAFSDPTLLKRMFLDILEGLIHMHIDRGLRHNDIKASNFLLTDDMHIVISDFGSVSKETTVVRSRKEALAVQDEAASKTTASIRAPELWDCPSSFTITGKADVWSFGCVMYLMLFSRTPFESPQEGLSHLAIMSARYAIPQSVPAAIGEFVPLLSSCLRTNADERAHMIELRALLTGGNLPSTPTIQDGVGVLSSKDALSDSCNFADFNTAFLPITTEENNVSPFRSEICENKENTDDSDFGEFVAAGSDCVADSM